MSAKPPCGDVADGLDMWQRIAHDRWGFKGYELTLDRGRDVVAHPTGKIIPKLTTYIREKVDMASGIPDTPAVPLSQLIEETPEGVVPDAFLAEIRKAVSEEQIGLSAAHRVTHMYGKNYRDLWRIRNAIIHRPPDLVVYPHTHAEVQAIVSAAHRHRVAVIPYGGGTNVTGGIEPTPGGPRSVCTLDMRRMNKVLWIEPRAKLACFQAGVLGPQLEAALATHGLTLGHDPDSFQHSTLGGWLAMRSSGAASNKYGDVENFTDAVKMATPVGTITAGHTHPRPVGPDLKELFLGSEGTLGVMTEAVVRVRDLPSVRIAEGFLFPTFEAAMEATFDVTVAGILPVVLRVYDSDETQLSFALKYKDGLLQEMLGAAVKQYLQTCKHFDLTKVAMCIMVTEGTPSAVAGQRADILGTFARHGAFALGEKAGATWAEKKYDLPLLRDFCLDHGLWADVLETTTTWANAVPLWRAVKAAVQSVWARQGVKGVVGMHAAHQYASGCCLYWTFAAPQQDMTDIKRFMEAKVAATDAIVRFGAALSHHHGIGYEVLPWARRSMGGAQIALLRRIKAIIDPRGVCNPGKLLPPGDDDSVEDEDLIVRSVRWWVCARWGNWMLKRVLRVVLACCAVYLYCFDAIVLSSLFPPPPGSRKMYFFVAGLPKGITYDGPLPAPVQARL